MKETGAFGAEKQTYSVNSGLSGGGKKIGKGTKTYSRCTKSSSQEGPSSSGDSVQRGIPMSTILHNQ